MCPGFISCFSDPTAVVASMCVHPCAFNAYMFALKFTLDGIMLWSFPCRASMATSTPRIFPVVIVEEGFPKGVSTVISSEFSRICGSSSPDPPIIPIFAILICYAAVI